MKFRVSQRFERLGDPCAETFDTREAAEAAAEKLRAEIAAEVAGWEILETSRDTGWADEVKAFFDAACIAGDAETYGTEAAQFIAEAAVEIDEID